MRGCVRNYGKQLKMQFDTIGEMLEFVKYLHASRQKMSEKDGEKQKKPRVVKEAARV